MKQSQWIVRRMILFLFTFLILTTSFLTVRAAGEVDPTFNPGLIKTFNGGNSPQVFRVNRIVVQTDGKPIIAGYFQTADKVLRSNITRLNTDGTVDTTFNPPSIITNTEGLTAIALQSDGKILICGDFSTVGGQNRPRIARLNSDGSLDNSFSLLNNTGASFSGVISDIKISAAGNITIAGIFTLNASGTQKNIARLLPDGTRDVSFTSPPIVSDGFYAYRIESLSNGLTLVTGADSSSANYIRRLNIDGSVDSTFNPISANGINALRLLADGKFLAGGGFTNVNGFQIRKLARFNSDGSLDTSFNIGNDSTNAPINDIEILAGGKILVAGNFTQYNFSTRNGLALLDAAGNLDLSFSYNGVRIDVQDTAVLPDGKILIGTIDTTLSKETTIIRLNSDSTSDPTFNLILGAPGKSNKILVQPDGKVLIAGFYSVAGGYKFSNSISRFNSDGTLDTTFAARINSNVAVSLDIRDDGKILVSYSPKMERLNRDGTIDLYLEGSSYDAKFLPEGGLIFGFSAGLRQYSATGVATSFRTDTDTTVRNILIQPDGKFIISGDFTTVAGQPRGRIARINTDGTLDTTFNPPGGASNSIFASALQPDGKIIIGGNFPVINSNTDYKYLARLNADGTLDTSFHPIVEGGVQSLKIQPNGKILVGGSMYSVNGLASRIVRLNQDGSLDTTFNPGVGPNDAVLSIDTEANGNVIIGGSFTRVGNFDRFGVARLISANQSKPLFDFDGDGRADVSVFRPSNGAWYLQQSTAGFSGLAFGQSGDILAPADYDGDGKTDLAVVRNGNWYIQRSQLGFTSTAFGDSNDVPVPADYDGDGRTDIAVFRPSNGTWYLLQSSAGFTSIAFGLGTDKPVPGDYNGDGRAEVAVFRPSNGYWYLSPNPATNYGGVLFGQAEDRPVPADYDGDGRTDVAVFRPSNGTWYLLQSSAGFRGLAFGLGTDIPVAADYDGDGKADVAVFRQGNWYLNRSTQGFVGIAFGISTDQPIPNFFVR